MGRAHRTARTGPAHRDRGGGRLRERLDHVRAAHGVCGTLRQEPLWPAFEGPRRRRDHARAESEELTKLILNGARSRTLCCPMLNHPKIKYGL